MVSILTLSLPSIRHVIKDFIWLTANLLHITKSSKVPTLTDNKHGLSSQLACKTLVAPTVKCQMEAKEAGSLFVQVLFMWIVRLICTLYI